MLKIGKLSESSFEMLKLGKSTKSSFGMLKLGELGKTSFEMLKMRFRWLGGLYSSAQECVLCIGCVSTLGNGATMNG